MSQLLTGPLFTIILTILAGIALRYALWYGKDQAHADDPNAVGDWVERTRTLQDAIAREQADGAHLREEYERIVQGYDSLKVALDEREEKLHEQRVRMKQLEQSAATSVSAEASTRDREALEAELAESRELLAGLQDELRTRSQDLHTSREEVDRARHEVELARQELEMLRSETESIDQEKLQVSMALENSARQRAKLEQQIRDEQRARRELSDELAALQAKAGQLQSELGTVREERDRAIAAQAATSSTLTSQLDRSRQQTEADASRIRKYAEELRRLGVTAKEEVDTLRQEHEVELLALRNQLSESLDEQKERLRGLRAEKEEVVTGLLREQEENERLRRLVATAAETEERLAALRDELAESRKLQEQRERELTGLTSRMDAAETERDELKTAVMRSERRVAELTGSVHRYEQEITNNDAAVRKLRVERDRLLTQLERERAERNALEQTLRTHIDTLEQLREDSQSLESLLQRQTVVQNSLRSHAERLRSAAYNKEAAQEESDIITIHKYDMPLAAAAQLHRHPVLGMVYSAPPAERDDLQRIAGIGEALEQKLNQVGVYSYEQIMNWNETTIDSFSNLIDLEDQITRDGWVAQRVPCNWKCKRIALPEKAAMQIIPRRCGGD